MTVTGATTAQVAATPYSPPYQYVSSSPATVQITGSVTSPVSNNPTGSAGGSDSDYAWAYLQAHMMSPPSYRYAYLLWMVLAGIAVIYAFAHHLRLSGGSVGASYAAFGIRRHTLGSKKPGRRNRALPSNNVMIIGTIITTVTIVLCLIGSDYIAPSSSILDFSTSFKRALQSASSPQYVIGKSFWTLGSRFGFMAFALFPAVVLLALKSPPAALLSLRMLTQLHADKLAILHRVVAWLVWAITTAHVALWTVQLFKDSRNQRSTWFSMWTNYRFVCGCVAYAAMCLVMVLSMRPIRKHQYEFFYAAHVILVVLTLVACIVHHPVLWYWIVAAASLWAVERGLRFLRLAHINGFFQGRRRSPLKAGPDYAHLSTRETYALQDFGEPRTKSRLSHIHATGKPEERTSDFGVRAVSGHYDEGSLQPLGSYESRHAAFSADPHLAYQQSIEARQPSGIPRSTTGASLAANAIAAETVPIPPGYALAQLLPSRTVRLTVSVPRPFTWAAGQSCLLYIPEISRFQSHPFTIVSNDGKEVVILVKARKGITRKLFERVHREAAAHNDLESAQHRASSLHHAKTSGRGEITTPPIHVKAWLDGPFGSACRVRWNEYASVVIICGGSGVSFGAAICDHVCRMIAKNRDIGSRKVVTQRIRFCWVVREYAEIAWVAGQLFRCQQMVTSAQLEISIFVTKAGTPRDDLGLPKPGFAKNHARRDSQDSVTSEMSQDTPSDHGDIDELQNDLSTQYADVIDLTNYDDEEDINDPAEQNLSDRIQHHGKVRRARSRKAAKLRSGQSVTPTRRNVFGQASDDAMQRYAADADPYSDSNAWEPPQRPSGSRMSGHASVDESLPPSFAAREPRRQSYRSIADSTYNMYDPYAGMAGYGVRPSPSPSIINFEDTHSMTGESVRDLLSRRSRTGSMVFMEESVSNQGRDAGLWIDEADYAAMNVMSEMARPGKPKLSSLIEEEIQQAGGSLIVATCGPVTLNTVVRNLVAKLNSPSRIHRGDKRGHIAIYSEDYES